MAQHRKINIINQWYKEQNKKQKINYNDLDKQKQLLDEVKLLIDFNFHDSEIMDVKVNIDNTIEMNICSYYYSTPENVTFIFNEVRYVDCLDDINGAQVEGEAIDIEKHGFWHEKKSIYSNKYAIMLKLLLSYPNLKGYPVKEFKICAENINIKYKED